MGGKKTTRHKSENTFKFKSFPAQLNETSVLSDIQLKDDSLYLTEDGSETSCLFRALTQRTELDMEGSFQTLVDKLGPSIRTLPQVLHEKRRIFKLLLAHLKDEANSSSLLSTLELIRALARDLDSKFIPKMIQFIKLIFNVIPTTRDVQHIEQCIQTVRYLFVKYRKHVQDQFPKYLSLLFPMWNSQNKSYVVSFTATSFRAVATKFWKNQSNNLISTLNEIIIRPHPEAKHGVAILLASMIMKTLTKAETQRLVTDCFNWPAGDEKIWCETIGLVIEQLRPYFVESADNIKVFRSSLEAQLANNSSNASIFMEYLTLLPLLLLNDKSRSEDRVSWFLTVASSAFISMAPQCEEVFTNIMCSIVAENSDKQSLQFPKAVQQFVNRISGQCLDKLSTVITKDLPIHPYVTYLVERYNSLEDCILKEVDPKDCKFTLLASDSISYAISSGRHFDESFHERRCAPTYYRRFIEETSAKKFSIPLPRLEVLDSCAMMTVVKDKSFLGVDSTLGMSEEMTRFFMVFNNLKFTNPRCDHCFSASMQICNNLIEYLSESCAEGEETKLWSLLFQVMQLLPSFVCNGIVLRSNDFLKAVETRIAYNLGGENQQMMSLWALKALDEFLYKASSTNFSVQDILVDSTIRKCLICNLQSAFKTVRALSLSILYQLKAEEEIKSALEECLKIEELNIRDISFVTAANEHFERLKVMAAYKVIIPIIANFALGYMFTNFKLVWPKCVDILKVCLEKDTKFAWSDGDGVSLAFENIHSDRLQTPKELQQFSQDDFIGRLSIGYFCWVKETRLLGEVETLDIETYRVNLWSALEGVNESRFSPVPRALFQKAEEIVDLFKLKEPFYGLDLTRESKGLRRALVPVLNFLAKSSTIGNEEKRNLWFGRLLDLLVSPDEIKRIVLKIILALKSNEIRRFSSYLEDITSVESLSRELQYLRSNLESKKVIEEHKEILMKVLTRVVIQKMKYSDVKNRPEILSTVATYCRGAEKGGVSLMSSLIKLGLQFSTTATDYKDTAEILKLFQAHVSLISAMLNTWRYQFVDECQQVFGILCEMYNFVKTLEDESLLALKKQALSSARSCLDLYFKLFPKAPIPESLVQNMLNTFVWPAIKELDTGAVTNVRRILKLFLVWSREARYRSLFLEKNIDNEDESIYHVILRLLTRSSTTRKVKVYLLALIFNLLTHENVHWPEEEMTDENIDKKDKLIPIVPRLRNPYQIGQQIIKLGKKEIIGALKDQGVFRDLCVVGAHAQLYTSLLPNLANSLGDSELLASFCRIIIGCLKSAKPDEEIAASCFKALKEALTDPEIDQIPILKDVLRLFTWAKTHELKKDLYRVVLTWKDSEIQPILLKLCSSIVNLLDKSPDLRTLYDGYKECGQIIESDAPSNLLFLEFLTHHCFLIAELPPHVEPHEARESIPLMELIVKRIAKHIKDGDSMSSAAKDFIKNVLIPNIKCGIDTKSGFSNILGILGVCIAELEDVHGLFKELKFLLDLDILPNLDDIQVQRKTVVMNKLAKVLKGSELILSAGTLFNIIKPLAERNLFNERTQKMAVNINELVDSSIEVLKAVLLRLPHNMYLRTLTSILRKRTDNKSTMNQLERILIAILDSYHFDLSLASAGPPKETGEEEEGNQGTDSCDEDEVQNQETESKDLSHVTLVEPEEAAQKFLRELENSIMPQLLECLQGAPITGHKLSERSTLSEEGIAKKFAYAKALVKLCCKLPKHRASDIWNMVIPKLCSDVKSRHESVRNSARQSLVESLKEMGLNYFNIAFNYLQANLKRGYEKHVLHFTINLILTKCHDEIKASSKPLPIKGILQLCFDEVFNPTIREEKKVVAIRSKTREAKADNAKVMLEACGEFAHDTDLLTTALEMGLEKVSQTSENAQASRNWLTNFGVGLLKNTKLPSDQIMIWLGTQLEKYLESVSSFEKEDNQRLTRKRKLEDRESSLIIKELESRRVKKGDYSHKNVLIIEFVFQCLHDTLKKTELRGEVAKSFVPYLVNALKGYSKVTNILATKCLTLFMEQSQSKRNEGTGSKTNIQTNKVFEFNRDEITLNSIWRRTFSTMATFSLSVSDDHTLVNAVFKCITTFLGTFTQFKILNTDFIVLIKSIKTYLTHGNCSSGAVKLAKGMIGRNLNSEELMDLMKNVKELSVTSHFDHILDSCRGLYAEYILAYCKSLNECAEEIAYFTQHLKNSGIKERASALMMLILLAQKLPEALVNELRSVYFTALTVALRFERDPRNRELISTCFKLFLRSKESVTEMAKGLFGLMKKEEKESYPIIAQIGGWIIAEGWELISKSALLRFIKFYKKLLNPANESAPDAIKLTLFAIRNILKVGFKPGQIWDPKGLVESVISDVGVLVRDHYLQSTDVWIRSLAMGIYGDVLIRLDLERLVGQLEGLTASSTYCPLIDNILELESKIEVHLYPFRKIEAIASQLFEPAKRNLELLLKMAIVFFNHPQSGDFWRRMLGTFVYSTARLINYEVTKFPLESKKRLLAYSLWEKLVAECSSDTVKLFMERLIRSAQRDMTDKNAPGVVHRVAEVLCDHMKKKVGDEAYQEAYIAVVQEMTKKRMEKRAVKRENLVLHPDVPRKRKKYKQSTPSSTTQ